MEVYHNIANHATFGGDARDKTVDDPTPVLNDDTHVFAGMSAAERYELDTFGILHMRGVLAAADLAAAQLAFSRLQGDPSLMSPLEEFPFAADRALESLATHPRLLPVLLELCGHATPYQEETSPLLRGRLLIERQATGCRAVANENTITDMRIIVRKHPGRCRADNLGVSVPTRARQEMVG